MLILILDDVQSRHDRFSEILVGHTLVHAFDYDEFVAAYELHHRFDKVFLDRDLSAKQACGIDGDEKTGEDAAKLIAALPVDRRPERVVVHSWNQPGARRMIQTLSDAGIPAVWVKFQS